MGTLTNPSWIDPMFLLCEIRKGSAGPEETLTMRTGLSLFYPDLNFLRLACYKNLPLFKEEYEEIKRLEKQVKETVDGFVDGFIKTFGEGNVDEWLAKDINKRFEEDGAKT